MSPGLPPPLPPPPPHTHNRTSSPTRLQPRSYSSIQKCEAGESYPGLKEVPLWDLSAQGGVFTMDYGE